MTKEEEKIYRRKKSLEAYHKNPELYKLRVQAYNKKNKSKIQIKNKKRYEEKKEQLWEEHAKYYENNKDEIKEKSKKYYKNNKDAIRTRNLLKLYNCSQEQYDEMFEKQQGCCKICGTHQTELNQKLSIDHCHVTGKIRGLLCKHCNHGLGKFKDNTILLQFAIDYLNQT